MGLVVLRQLREAHPDPQPLEVLGGVSPEERQGALRRVQPGLLQEGLPELGDQIPDHVLLAVGADVLLLSRGAVLEDVSGVDDALGQRAHQRQVVGLRGRRPQADDGLLPDVGVLVEHVLALEPLHREAQPVVELPLLVAVALVHVPVAGEPLLDLPQHRALEHVPAEVGDVVAVVGLRGGQHVEVVEAPQVGLVLAGHLLQLLLDRRDLEAVAALPPVVAVGHLVEGRDERVVDLFVAGGLRVGEEAVADHADARRDPEDLQVVPLVVGQRPAVLVGVVVGEAQVDAPVAVVHRLAIGARHLLEDERRPVVAQAHDRQAGGPRRLLRDGPLLAVDEDHDPLLGWEVVAVGQGVGGRRRGRLRGGRLAGVLHLRGGRLGRRLGGVPLGLRACAPRQGDGERYVGQRVLVSHCYLR